MSSTGDHCVQQRGSGWSLSTVIKRFILVSVDLTEGLKTKAKVPLKLVAPTIEKRTVDSKVVAAVRPGRRPNAVYRTREHLTETEVEKLIEAAMHITDNVERTVLAFQIVPKRLQFDFSRINFLL